MSAHWATVERGNGFVEVYAVDQHGCILNTEPACAIPARYGDWFKAWVLSQPCPYDDQTFPLLEHLPVMLRADGKNERV